MGAEAQVDITCDGCGRHLDEGVIYCAKCMSHEHSEGFYSGANKYELLLSQLKAAVRKYIQNVAGSTKLTAADEVRRLPLVELCVAPHNAENERNRKGHKV